MIPGDEGAGELRDDTGGGGEGAGELRDDKGIRTRERRCGMAWEDTWGRRRADVLSADAICHRKIEKGD